jgi:hypothetical protein
MKKKRGKIKDKGEGVDKTIRGYTPTLPEFPFRATICVIVTRPKEESSHDTKRLVRTETGVGRKPSGAPREELS